MHHESIFVTFELSMSTVVYALVSLTNVTKLG